MSAMLLVLGLAIAGATGWFVVAWLWPREATWSLSEASWRACLAMAVGLGLHSCVTFIWMCVAPNLPAALFGLDLALLIGAAVVTRLGSSPSPGGGRGWPVPRPGEGVKNRRSANSHRTSSQKSNPPCFHTLTRREDTPPSPGGRGGYPQKFLTAAALLSLLLFALSLLAAQIAHPHGTWDSWMIWNFRARFFYRAGPAWAAGILNVWPMTHPDYPLLLPLSIVRLWHYMGGESPAAPAALSILFPVLSVVLLWSAIARMRGPVQGALAALFLCAAPVAWPGLSHASLFFDTAGMQCADAPVGFFLLAALSAFPVLPGAASTPTSQPNHCPTSFALLGLLLASAAWTKNEGLLFSAAVLASLILLAFHRRRRHGAWSGHEPRDFMRLAAGALLPIGLILLVMKLMLAAQTDLFAHQSTAGLLQKTFDPARHRLILAYVLRTTASVPDPLLAGGLILFVLASMFRAAQPAPGVPGNQPHPLCRILAAPWQTDPIERQRIALTKIALVFICLGFYIIYLTTPNDLQFQLDTSLDRVVAQIWPSFVFLIFLSLRPWNMQPEGKLEG